MTGGGRRNQGRVSGEGRATDGGRVMGEGHATGWGPRDRWGPRDGGGPRDREGRATGGARAPLTGGGASAQERPQAQRALRRRPVSAEAQRVVARQRRRQRVWPRRVSAEAQAAREAPRGLALLVAAPVGPGLPRLQPLRGAQRGGLLPRGAGRVGAAARARGAGADQPERLAPSDRRAAGSLGRRAFARHQGGHLRRAGPGRGGAGAP